MNIGTLVKSMSTKDRADMERHINLARALATMGSGCLDSRMESVSYMIFV